MYIRMHAHVLMQISKHNVHQGMYSMIFVNPNSLVARGLNAKQKYVLTFLMVLGS